MANEVRSLSQALGDEKISEAGKSSVSLFPLKDGKTIFDLEAAFTFQYFPESVADSKGVTWGPKEMPGASLPVYQFTNSGERTISFTAMFSSDIDPTSLTSIPESVERRNVDIRAAVAWLRQFTLPDYVNGGDVSGTLTLAPSMLMLSMPGSGIGLAGGDNAALGDDDAIVCIMQECTVEYQSFFPSGVPRLASVSLSFGQVAQINNTVYFPRANARMRGVAAGSDKSNSSVPYLGYKLKPKLPLL